MRIFAVLLLLSGCSSASPKYLGVTPQRVAAGGHQFDVYSRPDEVQVIRLNRTFLPDTAGVIIAGAAAAEMVTGCEPVVRRAKADAAIMTFPLRCPK